MNDHSHSDIRRDLRIARMLRRPDLYSGRTWPRDRMERQRHEILAQGLADVRIWPGETWGQAFERWHGEPLDAAEVVA